MNVEEYNESVEVLKSLCNNENIEWKVFACVDSQSGKYEWKLPSNFSLSTACDYFRLKWGLRLIKEKKLIKVPLDASDYKLGELLKFGSNGIFGWVNEICDDGIVLYGQYGCNGTFAYNKINYERLADYYNRIIDNKWSGCYKEITI